MNRTYIKMPLEVAVFSGDSILKAQNQGASGVELNATGSYPLGGTTPSVSEYARVAGHIKIPVRIMIRPRGAPSDGTQDFIYTAAEVEAMGRSITEFKATGLMDPCRGDGFVFGILEPSAAIDSYTGQPEGIKIDERQCKQLIDIAKPFSCVFHRAFDPIAATKRAMDGVQTLIDIGFHGLLTAGGFGNAVNNIRNIEFLCHRMATRIQIIIGGGLRSDNVLDPARQLAEHGEGAVWMHSSALTERPDRPAEQINSDELVRMVAQLSSVSVA
ncbi:hypothetical protein QQS21_004092 [Conoideocrella luteorostrata]|uniref:Copper homeostasis protein cutC homolog n=1 Tax=Conoideocrella luteorostrata TaxID=1105319 RepID=A0AAJ0G034_9HYPO|nr:hypothetical protein QQS21_004092 [Conoideocrella luteorostrata]